MSQISYPTVAIPLIIIQIICCIVNVVYNLPKEFTATTTIIIFILGIIIGMYMGLFAIKK